MVEKGPASEHIPSSESESESDRMAREAIEIRFRDVHASALVLEDLRIWEKLISEQGVPRGEFDDWRTEVAARGDQARQRFMVRINNETGAHENQPILKLQ